MPSNLANLSILSKDGGKGGALLGTVSVNNPIAYPSIYSSFTLCENRV